MSEAVKESVIEKSYIEKQARIIVGITAITQLCNKVSSFSFDTSIKDEENIVIQIDVKNYRINYQNGIEFNCRDEHSIQEAILEVYEKIDSRKLPTHDCKKCGKEKIAHTVCSCEMPIYVNNEITISKTDTHG